MVEKDLVHAIGISEACEAVQDRSNELVIDGRKGDAWVGQVHVSEGFSAGV